jgi:periplasmic copper chaperone A
MKALLVSCFFAVVSWSGIACAAGADVAVTNAWVRATVPGQPVAAAYMDIRASKAMKLVGVSSPVAERGEIHEMKDEDGMMKMRAVQAVDLPAGKTISLAPGGLHVMLFGLSEPLTDGRKVTLTLKLRRASGATFSHVIEVPVKAP